MKLPRIAVAAAALLSLAASGARALDYWWERDLDFANKLTAPGRKYFDLAEVVLVRLENDTDIIGIQKAKLLHRIGDFFAEKADEYASGRNWREKLVEYLNKARVYYQKFLEHDAVKTNRKMAEEAFRVRTRVSWLSLSLAEGEAKALDAPELTKEEKEKVKAKVIKLFDAAIDEFKKAIPEKEKEVIDLRAKEPTKAKEADEWRRTVLDPARGESFLANHLYCQARFRKAKFMREAKFSDPEVDMLLKAVEKDLSDMLLKFNNFQAVLPNAQLTRVQVRFEMGATRDKDTDEGVTDIWDRKEGFNAKRIPCEAQCFRVKLYLRQKKSKEAQAAADDLLKYRTGVWGAEAKGRDASRAVCEILEHIAGDPGDEYDQRSTAAVILLEAETFAAQGAESAEQRKPAKAVEKFYATAHDLAEGVRLAKVPMDRKYQTLIELWREKARKPPSLSDRMIRLEQEMGAKEWGKAAVTMSDIIRDGGYPQDKLWDSWMMVGSLYFNAKRYYEGYTAYWAAARWFPNRDQEKACSFTLTCLKRAKEASKGTDSEVFHHNLYERAYREVADLLGKQTALPIIDGKKARSEGRFDDALKELGKVLPDNKFHPEALFETAVTRRMMAEKAYRADRKIGPGTTRQGEGFGPPVLMSEEAKAATKACVDAFEAIETYYQKKLPALQKDEEKADDRKRLIHTASVGFVAYTNALLEEFLNKPAKVIELTAPGFEKRYPGMEAILTPPCYPLALFSRIRAAHALVRADPEHADPNLAVVEQVWKTLREKAKDFQYLDKAAANGAGAYGAVADRLDSLVRTAQDPAELKKVTDPELAKRLADPAEVKKLADRGKTARNRCLDFYLQLIEVNPKQPVNTYRFIVRSLYARDLAPRSNDLRKITELAPGILDALEGEKDAQTISMSLEIKAILGLAFAQLKRFPDAIPILEEVSDSYEKNYQEALKRWTDFKAKKEELEAKKDPRAARMKMIEQPARPSFQPDTMYWLARSYVDGQVRDKYPTAIRLFIRLTSIHLNGGKMPEFWDATYWYCEANAKNGTYGDAIGLIQRAMSRDPNLHSKENRARFLAFLNRIRPEVERSPDAKVRDLLRQLDEIIKTLSK